MSKLRFSSFTSYLYYVYLISVSLLTAFGKNDLESEEMAMIKGVQLTGFEIQDWTEFGETDQNAKTWIWNQLKSMGARLMAIFCTHGMRENVFYADVRDVEIFGTPDQILYCLDTAARDA